MDARPHIPVPHASPALRHIRLSVTVSAWIVGLSLFDHIFTWAMVNYTDLRVSRIDPAQVDEHPVDLKRARPPRGEVRSLTGVDPKPEIE